MKKRYYILLLLLANVFCFTGCYENKGNYDYVEIREFTVSAIKLADGRDTIYSAITNLDTIYIEPVIETMGGEFNESGFEYIWKIQKGEKGFEFLADTKVLKLFVNLAIGSHTILLNVTDKATGVTDGCAFTLNVSNLYGKGMLVLTEDDNKFAKLDMVSTVRDTIVFRDVLAPSGVPQYKNPISLYTTGFFNNNEIHIFTEDGDYLVNKSNFSHRPGVDAIKYKMVATSNFWLGGVAREITDPQGRDRVIYMNGYLFPFDNMQGNVYLYPVNIYPKNPKHFKMGNKVGTSYKKPQSYQKGFVLYDNDEKRFAFYHSSKNNGTAADSLKDATTDIRLFSWKTGLDFVTTFHSFLNTYGDNTTILKDENGKYFAYRYYVYISRRSVVKVGRFDISDATDISKAELWFASSTQPYIYYTVGNKVYAYDLEYGKKCKLVLELPSPITAIYDSPEHYAEEKGKNIIYFATFAGTPGSGKIYKYQILGDPNKLEINPFLFNEKPVVWEGFDKVKSFMYK